MSTATTAAGLLQHGKGYPGLGIVLASVNSSKNTTATSPPPRPPVRQYTTPKQDSSLTFNDTESATLSVKYERSVIVPPQRADSLPATGKLGLSTNPSSTSPTRSVSPLPSSLGQRRRSSARKLPPSLTESLEELVLVQSVPKSINNSIYPLERGRRPSDDSDSNMTTSSTVDSASISTGSSKMYTLEVAAPIATGSATKLALPSTLFVQNRKGSVHSIRRKPIKRSSISAPVIPPRNESVDLPPLLPPKQVTVIQEEEAQLFNRFSIAPTDSTLPMVSTISPKSSLMSMRPDSATGSLNGRASSSYSAASSLGPVTPVSSISSRSMIGRSKVQPRIQALAKSESNPASSPALTCSSTSGTDSTCGTWSSFDIEYHPSGQRRETRREKKERKRIEKARFDESTPPSMKELFEASLMDVIDESGETVRFGDLVRGKKTIVVFIRHWFCPLCAQYIRSILNEVSPDALEEAGVDLIIIGNGSAKMIDGYANKYFKSPFKTYTDPTLSLYRALGLTRQTGDAGQDEDKGDYLTETVMETTVNTIKRATKMPLRNPGHFLQLGGEFIFDGTLNVIYTHRMINTRSHAPIRDVCAEAGVRLEFIHYEPGPPCPPVHQRSRTNLLDTVPEDGQPRSSSEADVVVIPGERRDSGATDVVAPEVDETRLFHSTPAGNQQEKDEDSDGLDDWQAEREKMLERIQALRTARRLAGAGTGGKSSTGRPGSSGSKQSRPNSSEGRVTREVRIFGVDEVDEMGQLSQSRYVY